ncbi:MAG: rod shape-determining protein MreD [Candidatus Rokubacteria bacterium]|nr:rod shape-determining protein MreD [Candidatus Rokubacteria bacterium]
MRIGLLLMTLGGAVAQTSVVQALSVGGAIPDLPFVVMAFLALRRGPEVGCLAGFLAGLLQDATGGGLVGVQALTKALAGFTLGLAGGRLQVGSPLVQVAGLVLLTAGEGLLRFGLLQLFHYPASLSALLADVIAPQALYNGALGAACLVAVGLAEAARARLSWR